MNQKSKRHEHPELVSTTVIFFFWVCLSCVYTENPAPSPLQLAFHHRLTLYIISLFTLLFYFIFYLGCTIIASSLFGSALTLLCADYFVENFKVISWFFDNLSNGDDWYGLLTNSQRGLYLCVGSQIILALWPALTLFGIIVQCCITAKGVEYRSEYGIVSTQPSIVIGHCNADNFTTNKTSSNNRCKNPEEARLEQKHRKYRYLYQVRTAHGDVISQVYHCHISMIKLFH